MTPFVLPNYLLTMEATHAPGCPQTLCTLAGTVRCGTPGSHRGSQYPGHEDGKLVKGGYSLCKEGSHRASQFPTTQSKMAALGRWNLGWGEKTGPGRGAEPSLAKPHPSRDCVSPSQGWPRGLLGPCPATVLLGPVSLGSNQSRNRVGGEQVGSQLYLGWCTLG